MLVVELFNSLQGLGERSLATSLYALLMCDVDMTQQDTVTCCGVGLTHLHFSFCFSLSVVAFVIAY